uniref:Uncharacterized protein n=1 Tax=Anguilla anguilla TaxID=7936 RepID=A0A0E9T2U6_ANGAN
MSLPAAALCLWVPERGAQMENISESIKARRDHLTA